MLFPEGFERDLRMRCGHSEYRFDENVSGSERDLRLRSVFLKWLNSRKFLSSLVKIPISWALPREI